MQESQLYQKQRNIKSSILTSQYKILHSSRKLWPTKWTLFFDVMEWLMIWRSWLDIFTEFGESGLKNPLFCSPVDFWNIHILKIFPSNPFHEFRMYIFVFEKTCGTRNDLAGFEIFDIVDRRRRCSFLKVAGFHAVIYTCTHTHTHTRANI